MGVNDAIHDEVAAKIAAHHAAILADLAKPRRGRRATATARRKKPKATDPLQPSLFGATTPRVESYNQTRSRLSALSQRPGPLVEPDRRSLIRCLDCDHGLVVRVGKVICPKCGSIFGDEGTLRIVKSAFPGACVVRESDL